MAIEERLHHLDQHLNAHGKFPPGAADELLNCIQALLKLHTRPFHPASRGEKKGQYYCSHCSVDDMYVVWPCPTYNTIERHLGG